MYSYYAEQIPCLTCDHYQTKNNIPLIKAFFKKFICLQLHENVTQNVLV
jgi:hypothetical protein